METNDQIKIACDNCGQRILVAANSMGSIVQCPTCQTSLKVSTERMILEGEVEETQATEWLHELELLFRKMIVGIFRFIFLIFPNAIKRLFIFCFPKAVRVVRVLCIFAAWLTLVIWPLIITYWIPQKFPGVHMPAFVTDNPGMTYFGCWTWVALAIVASIWGAVYVRLKQRTKAAK